MPIIRRIIAICHSKAITIPKSWITNAEDEAGANDQFTVKIAEKPEEIKALLEVGFEYVCQKDTLIFLRKRK